MKTRQQTRLEVPVKRNLSRLGVRLTGKGSSDTPKENIARQLVNEILAYGKIVGAKEMFFRFSDKPSDEDLYYEIGGGNVTATKIPAKLIHEVVHQLAFVGECEAFAVEDENRGPRKHHFVKCGNESTVVHMECSVCPYRGRKVFRVSFI